MNFDMNNGTGLASAAEGVAESYTKLRDYLIADAERRYTRELPSHEIHEWREKRPRTGEEYLSKRLGLDEKLIQSWTKEMGEAYRKHYASTADARLAEARRRHSPALTIDPKVLHPGAQQLIPYASLVIANNKALLGDAPEFLALPSQTLLFWYELQHDWTQRKEILIDEWGDGTGTVGIFFPGYNGYAYKSVNWIFYYNPPTVAADWSCYANVWQQGDVHCWADDSWYNSLYASIRLGNRLILSPDTSTGKGSSSWSDNITGLDEKTVLEYADQNIDVSVTDGSWPVSLGPVMPHPLHRNFPHWVVVSVDAKAVWRGESHVMLNFSKGYVANNPNWPYGVRVESATVFQPLLLSATTWNK